MLLVIIQYKDQVSMQTLLSAYDIVARVADPDTSFKIGRTRIRIFKKSQISLKSNFKLNFYWPKDRKGLIILLIQIPLVNLK